MRLFTVMLLVLLATSVAFGGTIKGVVKDATTDEPLIGANVVLVGSALGTITDEDGFFILENVPEGKWRIQISYLGYMDFSSMITVGSREVSIEAKLKPTVFEGQEIVVEVNRAKERQTPVTFSEVDQDEILRRYATQDVPDLLRAIPGVFTTTSGLGEAEIRIRGFDPEHIQIMINGVPVNDPESQWVYWSNWTGLSGNAASIQVQRGVGASLVGSGAFGGSVNIVTGRYSATPSLTLRSSVAGYVTQGGYLGTNRIADGLGGSQTYNPFNQAFSIDYVSGLLADGKLNLYLRYERKSGDYYITNTYYNGHAFYLGLQSILGNHVITFNAHGAPQRHNQARSMQDMNLLKKLGREYNRYNHPYQENYYFKPQFELHHDWAINDRSFLKTNAFLTFGRGGGRYLRNDYFDVNTGLVTFKQVSAATDAKNFGRHARFIYEMTGQALTGYNPATNEFVYNGDTTTVSKARNLISSTYDHSWRNDSQNHHIQYGFNTAYQNKLSDMITVTLGGEARYWKARHFAQSFDFRMFDLNTGSVKRIDEVQLRYDYDGIVINTSAFGRLLISPINDLTIMLDGQYARYSSRVEERPIRVYDFAAQKWTDIFYYQTRDLKDENGNPKYKDSDYQRVFTFFMPKAGFNYNITPEFNFFGNISVSKKEPKTADWYSRSSGPGANQPKDENGNPIELKPESLTNYEAGIGYYGRYVIVKANAYLMNFEDKIERVVNQAGELVTINAGKARHMGLELEARFRYHRWDGLLSATYSRNRWQEMNVQKIFGINKEDVVNKVVPFAPERIFNAELGYNIKGFRFGLSTSYWDEYYGNYDNTAKLPAFFELNAVIAYHFKLAGSDVDIRLNLNNITNRENYTRAAWTRDFNRNDDLAGKYYMYVVQAPLFYTFLTTQITL